jgi:predicted porin
MQKPLALLLASLPLTTVPLLAAAQGFEGAAGEFQYQHYDDGAGFTIGSVEGYLDAAWAFGRMGTQIGLTLGKEVNSSDTIDFNQYSGLTGHLTYDVSDSLRLGAMVLVDNDPGNVSLYAAEALYLNGPLRVEGRIGDSFGTADNSLVEAKASYAFGSAVTARAGVSFSDYGADQTYRVVSLGAGYKISDRVELYGDASRHRNEFAGIGTFTGTLFDLGIRVNLGGDDTRLFSFQPLN